MGLLGDLLNGLLGCLCSSKEEPPQETYAPPQRPEVVQQPTPVYLPQQQPHPRPHRPPAADNPHQPGHKKHKKHKDDHQDHAEPYGETHTAHPPSLPHVPVVSPPSRPWSPGRPDPNQLNQQNEYYVDLRNRANNAGDEMARCFENAHQAYEGRDGARAKELSNAGKAKKEEMERLNRDAAAWIFRENNTDSKPGEVDLHGLYVKEAIQYTDQSIQEAKARGDSNIRLIVGKGLHSTKGVAKLKPAIEELIQKHGLVAELDEHNAGVLIVNLNGQTTGVGQVLGADELTRGLEQKRGECIIM